MMLFADGAEVFVDPWESGEVKQVRKGFFFPNEVVEALSAYPLLAE